LLKINFNVGKDIQGKFASILTNFKIFYS